MTNCSKCSISAIPLPLQLPTAVTVNPKILTLLFLRPVLQWPLAANLSRSRLSLFSNLPSTNQRSRPLPCLLSPPPACQSISQGRFRSWDVYHLCFRSGKNLNVLSILKNCI
ncbi:unnamed protein product [Malus baccata var. baccata]